VDVSDQGQYRLDILTSKELFICIQINVNQL